MLYDNEITTLSLVKTNHSFIIEIELMIRNIIIH